MARRGCTCELTFRETTLITALFLIGGDLRLLSHMSGLYDSGSRNDWVILDGHTVWGNASHLCPTYRGRDRYAYSNYEL